MKRNKFLYIITIIYGILWIGYVMYYLHEQRIAINDNQTQINDSKINSFTGNTFDPDFNKIEDDKGIINSGSTILSDIDRITGFMDNGFYRVYNPPMQPKVSGSYEEKSNMLNNFITKNNFYFTTTSKLSEGYLLIKTEKPLGKNEDIFLYFHNTDLGGYTVSGKLSKGQNLGNHEKGEYLYKIDNIPIYRFYDKKLIYYDWLTNELHKTKKVHFIAGYITTSSGNSIKEIIIAGQ